VENNHLTLFRIGESFDVLGSFTHIDTSDTALKLGLDSQDLASVLVDNIWVSSVVQSPGDLSQIKLIWTHSTSQTKTVTFTVADGDYNWFDWEVGTTLGDCQLEIEQIGGTNNDYVYVDKIVVYNEKQIKVGGPTSSVTLTSSSPRHPIIVPEGEVTQGSFEVKATPTSKVISTGLNSIVEVKMSDEVIIYVDDVASGFKISAYNIESSSKCTVKEDVDTPQVAIDNNRVVFKEDDGIYICNIDFGISTQKYYHIPHSTSASNYPDISGDNVVWVDHGTSNKIIVVDVDLDNDGILDFEDKQGRPGFDDDGDLTYFQSDGKDNDGDSSILQADGLDNDNDGFIDDGNMNVGNDGIDNDLDGNIDDQYELEISYSFEPFEGIDESNEGIDEELLNGINDDGDYFADVDVAGNIFGNYEPGIDRTFFDNDLDGTYTINQDIWIFGSPALSVNDNGAKLTNFASKDHVYVYDRSGDGVFDLSEDCLWLDEDYDGTFLGSVDTTLYLAPSYSISDGTNGLEVSKVQPQLLVYYENGVESGFDIADIIYLEDAEGSLTYSDSADTSIGGTGNVQAGNPLYPLIDEDLDYYAGGFRNPNLQNPQSPYIRAIKEISSAKETKPSIEGDRVVYRNPSNDKLMLMDVSYIAEAYNKDLGNPSNQRDAYCKEILDRNGVSITFNNGDPIFVDTNIALTFDISGSSIEGIFHIDGSDLVEFESGNIIGLSGNRVLYQNSCSLI